MAAEEGSNISRYVLYVIDSLNKKVTADRFTYIKNRIEENRIKLSMFTQNTYNLSKIRKSNTSNGTDLVLNLLIRRQDDALCSLHSLEVSSAEDGGSCQEESSYATSTVIVGGNLGGKNAIRPIKLPEVPKLAPYTTWMFLDRPVYNHRHFSTSPILLHISIGYRSQKYIPKICYVLLDAHAAVCMREGGKEQQQQEIMGLLKLNMRMNDDQYVLGRRRIYYDANCGEAYGEGATCRCQCVKIGGEHWGGWTAGCWV